MRFAFGPQHPSSHGVLTIILFLANEYICLCDCHIGYLHRGTEKLLEFKHYEQCTPYFDRFDYCSVICNEHLLVFAFELLLHFLLFCRVSLIRCVLLEISRCFNGLLAISCSMLDIGCLTPLLWAFEERDKVCLLFDFLCGCRMHCAFLLVCGVLDDFCCGFIDYCLFICFGFVFLMDILDCILLLNRLAYIRLRGVAVFDLFDVCCNSISGGVARSVGLLLDCRFFSCYECYCFLSFFFVYGICGDAFDRFVCRLFDMRMSVLLVKALLFVFCFFGFFVMFCSFFCDFLIETVIYVFFMC